MRVDVIVLFSAAAAMALHGSVTVVAQQTYACSSVDTYTSSAICNGFNISLSELRNASLWVPVFGGHLMVTIQSIRSSSSVHKENLVQKKRGCRSSRSDSVEHWSVRVTVSVAATCWQHDVDNKQWSKHRRSWRRTHQQDTVEGEKCKWPFDTFSLKVSTIWAIRPQNDDDSSSSSSSSSSSKKAEKEV